MVERWRPNFDAEFREEIQKFLDRHDEIPYNNPRDFVESIVKNTIMDIEVSRETIEQAAREKIKKDLDLD